jgi:CBS domain-containing protein
MEEKTTHTETIEVTGDDLVAKVKEIVHEGNVRRIIIKNEDGEQVIEIPLTVGVVGALLLPALAAIGAVAALLSKCTIEVEREEE